MHCNSRRAVRGTAERPAREPPARAPRSSPLRAPRAAGPDPHSAHHETNIGAKRERPVAQMIKALLQAWARPDLEKSLAAITAGSVVFAPLAWAVKRWLNGRRARADVSRGIRAELDDSRKALDGTDGRRYDERTIVDTDSSCPVPVRRKIRYVQAFLNCDAYDSFLHSGRLVMLDAKQVQDIQNIYQLIKHHNEYLKLLQPLFDREIETETSMPAVTGVYLGMLDRHDAELLEKIPRLMEKLGASRSLSGRLRGLFLGRRGG